MPAQTTSNIDWPWAAPSFANLGFTSSMPANAVVQRDTTVVVDRFGTIVVDQRP
jgi:hypothetical protein